MSNKGLTIAELLVTIVVMAVISGMAVFTVDVIVNNARQKVDRQNLITLNKATDNYVELELIDTSDAFQGINSDYYRVEKLASLGYLDQVVQAQQKDAEFRWNVLEQYWELLEGGNIYNDFSNGYDFSGMTLQDATEDGAITIKGNNVTYDEGSSYVTVESSKAALMKPASGDSYSYSVIFSAQDYSDPRPLFVFDYDQTTKAGFAILLRLNRDSVRLQKFTNDTRYSNIKSISTKNGGIIPNWADDPDWVTTNHTTRLVITRIDSSTKQVTIYIDGSLLASYEYTSVATNNQLYYGAGTKHNRSDLYIYSLS